jgi:hypothetical protein
MVSRLNEQQPGREGQQNVGFVKIPISAINKKNNRQNVIHRNVVTKQLRVSLARIDVEKELRRLKEKSIKCNEDDDDVVVLSSVKKTVPSNFRFNLTLFMFCFSFKINS